MAELKPGDPILVPAVVEEVTPDFVYTRRASYADGRYQFHPDEVVPSNSAQISELRYLREREAHFAKVLGITDGGRYRNDWDATLEIVRQIATLQQRGHIALTVADGSDFDYHDQACLALAALARLLPEDKP